MAMFLDNEELIKLTGKEQHAAQKRVLLRKKIPFDENAIGELLVSRSYIERRLSGEDVNGFEQPVSRINFGYLDKYAKAQG